MSSEIKNFFRYPGGKNKLKNEIYSEIKNVLDINNITSYYEPFLGGGSFALFLAQVLPNNIPFYLNDFDKNLISLWRSVKNNKDELIDKIYNYTPTIETYISFKEDLKKNIDNDNNIESGFKKLVLHQISFSGLGVKSGSPIGGFTQNSKYKIDCRWSPKTLEKNILNVNKILNERDVIFSSVSFNSFLNQNIDTDSLVYLDPPYYEMGNQLYQFGMDEKEHLNLFEILKNADYKWLLSYDNNEFIKNLYKDYIIKLINVNYTIVNGGKNSEILIEYLKHEHKRL